MTGGTFNNSGTTILLDGTGDQTLKNQQGHSII